jgi:hypothetical protein
MNKRYLIKSVLRQNASAPPISRRLAIALCFPAVALSACYVVPIAPDGTPLYPAPGHVMTWPPSPPAPAPGTVAGRPFPAVLNVRLYPANDLANQTGMLTGTVTNMMSGKGRFQFEYQGELLAGEATRVSGEERRGIASAYGPRGTYASCEYQMQTPYQGAGACTFSNGAKYQVHIGT